VGANEMIGLGGEGQREIILRYELSMRRGGVSILNSMSAEGEDGAGGRSGGGGPDSGLRVREA
jgi:hypothetical protein